MTDQQTNALLAAMAGGSGMGLALDSGPIANAYSRRHSPAIPFVGGLSEGGKWGSGEARMSSNIARRLRRMGINAVYANAAFSGKWPYDTFDLVPESINSIKPSTFDFLKTLTEDQINIIANAPNDADAILQLTRGGMERQKAVALVSEWGKAQADIANATGVKLSDAPNTARKRTGHLGRIFSNARKSGVDPDLVQKMLSNGKFSDFRAGELADDIQLLGKRMFDGSLRVMSGREYGRYAESAPGAFLGNRMMTYSEFPGATPNDIRYADWLSTSLNQDTGSRVPKMDSEFLYTTSRGNTARIPYEEGDVVRNLAKDMRFSANFNPEVDLSKTPLHATLIPGSNVNSSIANRYRALSKVQHALDARFTRKMIEGVNPAANLRGKKIILISGGAAGPLAMDKLRETFDAVKGRNDVHILVQGGNGARANTGILNQGVAKLVSQLPKDKVTLVDTVPSNVIRRLYNGVDVNLGYSGSSSLSELISFRTPTIFTTDTQLNQTNAQYGNRFWNMPTADTRTMALDHKIRDIVGKNPNISRSDLWKAIIEDPTSGGFGMSRDVSAAEYERLADMLRKNPGEANRSRQEFAKTLGDMLDHSKSIRNSDATQARVLKILKEQKLRNSESFTGIKNILKGLGAVKGIPLKYKLPAIATAAFGAGSLAHGLSGGGGTKPVAAIEKKSSAGLQSAYRRGFMRKCAELKVDDRLSNALCIGALLRRSRMRNASSLT